MTVQRSERDLAIVPTTFSSIALLDGSIQPIE
jgi:hypothetical protein